MTSTTMVGILGPQPPKLAVANTAADGWCEEVDDARHSEIAAVPAQRLAEVELALLGDLPSLTPSGLLGGRRELRKVDKLSCVRFGIARSNGEPMVPDCAAHRAGLRPDSRIPGPFRRFLSRILGHRRPR